MARCLKVHLWHRLLGFSTPWLCDLSKLLSLSDPSFLICKLDALALLTTVGVAENVREAAATVLTKIAFITV